MTLEQAIQLGMRHHSAGQLPQAEAVYRNILQQVPNQPDAMHLLGVIAQQVGQPQAAVELIGRAITANPKVALFHSNISEAYRTLGMFPEAESAARQAIQLDARLAAAHANLGTILYDQKRHDEAAAALQKALDLEPQSPSPLSVLGAIYAHQGKFEQAIETGRRAVAASANDPLSHNNLATSLELAGKLPDAEQEYRKAVELNPRFFQAWNNLGSVIRKQARLEEAIPFWEQAAAVAPDFPDARWNLGLGYLTVGDFERGWPLYEWRFRCSHTAKYYRSYAVPHWTGFDLKGKTILLYPEQGFGDVFQFARFIPQVAERGATVLLHMPRELVDVMQGVKGVLRVIGPDEPLPPFDTHQALLSLPSVLKTTLSHLPAKVPYLHPDPARSAEWEKRIQVEPGKKKVGLVFAGRPLPDPKRSCSLAELAPLADASHITFFSLQLGEAAEQLKNSPPRMQIIDLHEHLRDFADTAAAIFNLDLLISIDTAAAHIGGALGIPTWTMLPLVADFRWMLNRPDSPWYPTMRLYRQSRADDWSDVISRLRHDLVNF